MQRTGNEPVRHPLPFDHTGTDWDARIVDFLKEHPDSSLLAVVQHLWPDFLSFPAERRAGAWFWVKDELRGLKERQRVWQRLGVGDIALWSAVETPLR